MQLHKNRRFAGTKRVDWYRATSGWHAHSVLSLVIIPSWLMKRTICRYTLGPQAVFVKTRASKPKEAQAGSVAKSFTIVKGQPTTRHHCRHHGLGKKSTRKARNTRMRLLNNPRKRMPQRLPPKNRNARPSTRVVWSICTMIYLMFCPL